MEKQMTHIEFIEDTVEHFSADLNRRCSTEVGSCRYSPNADGLPEAVKNASFGCAIGRFMTEEQQGEADALSETAVQALPAKLIPHALQHFSRKFLGEIQTLHDIEGYWEEGGLSPEGTKHVTDLKTKYAGK